MCLAALGVAQSFTLLYRRVVLGTASERDRAFGLSSGPQSATLRYSRVQLCATISWRHALHTHTAGLGVRIRTLCSVLDLSWNLELFISSRVVGDRGRRRVARG